MPTSQIAFRTSNHPHMEALLCPYCDQPIPNDRAQEIEERFKEDQLARERRMNEKFARERQQIESNAKAAGSRLQKPPHRRSSLRPNGRKMKR